MFPTDIQIIGEGNVAFHLAYGLSGISEINSVQVLSRRIKNSNLFESISDKVK